MLNSVTSGWTKSQGRGLLISDMRGGKKKKEAHRCGSKKRGESNYLHSKKANQRLFIRKREKGKVSLVIGMKVRPR